MTKILSILMKSVFVLLVVTVIGQLPAGGVSVEHRYHRFVNSPNFQDAYWNLTRPVTWTVEKGQEIVRNFRANHSGLAR